MTTELSIIDQRQLLGKTFVMYGSIENPMFWVKDVADWIEHSNITMMLKSIDDDEKVKIRPKQSLGLLTTNNDYWFLTENGLYEVLMLSRKPIAKQFKKEVKKILKQIRLTGGYIPYSENDTNEQIMAKAFLIANKTIEAKNKVIQELSSKAECFDKFLGTKNYMSLNKAAKGIKQSRNKMMEFLRNEGVLFKDGNDNLPYQRFIDSGYFIIDYVVGRDGLNHATTKVSSKGVTYIFKLYQKVGTIK